MVVRKTEPWVFKTEGTGSHGGQLSHFTDGQVESQKE